MFQFLAMTQTGCRRSYQRHLLHRITTRAITAVAALVAQVAYAQPVNADQASRPNIVLIMADDLGWSDTTLYGTTKLYETPNIARLARSGMTFTRAYAVSPLCSPTRAAILTGLHPARTGITSPTCHLPTVRLQAEPGKQAQAQFKSVPVQSVTRLDTKYYTLAEALRDNGYRTGHFGKWHLGHSPYSPLEHGFDVDIPHWPGPGPAGSYVAPWKFPDFDPDTPKEHIEDRMAKEAVAFMERNKDRPFFLNYWMFSVHAPFDAKRDLIEKYKAKVTKSDPQRSPTYAAMIESMDDAVGTLLKTLDRLGIADRTIVVFASDNGGNMYNQVDGTTPTSNAPLRGGKATIYEGGIRGPCIIRWPGTTKAGSHSNVLIQSCDFYPTILSMLGVEPKQRFDGLSLTPALHQKSMPARAIFTYFPHQPRVTDWLPPSISVHSKQWKLIRIFYGGENGQHRWKLFNLENDPGEAKDLASLHPQKVKELDRLLAGFLKQIKAVQPTRNPRFDPSQYRPDDEGKARPRSAGRKSRRQRQSVAGWQAAGDCRLTSGKNGLTIRSTGRDPYLIYSLPKPLPKGKYEVAITYRSKAGGRGQLFWREQGVNPAFFRDRSKLFDMQHDNEQHTLRLSFSSPNRLLAIRLDPGQRPGVIVVRSMTIKGLDSKSVRVLIGSKTP